MAKQSNLNIFLDVFAHILEEQWQVDVLLKAGDSHPDAAISAHKLVLVFISSFSFFFWSITSSYLFFCYLV